MAVIGFRRLAWLNTHKDWKQGGTVSMTLANQQNPPTIPEAGRK